MVDNNSFIITAEPVLVTKPPGDLTYFTYVKHFALRYKDLTFSDITDVSQLISALHNHYHNANENNFYISEIEVYSGSILLEGTLYASSASHLSRGFTHILNTARNLLTHETLEFMIDDVNNDDCSLTTSDNRILGLATSTGSCYLHEEEVEAALSETAESLQTWAIALIVISVLVFVALLVAITLMVKNKDTPRHRMAWASEFGCKGDDYVFD